MTARVKTYAKLNLTLDVMGKKDGYHLLDSLAVSVDLFDTVVARPRKDGNVKLTMHSMGSEYLPEEKNNAYLAALRFREKFQTAGADITVWKNIPMGAGLGGSSADIAGVLLALAEVFGIEKREIKPLADTLGSDSGYQTEGGFARLTGRGEFAEKLGSPPSLRYLLVCPEERVNTAECFARFDEAGKNFPPRTERALDLLSRGDEEGAARLFGNALTEAAVSLQPAVKDVLLSLKALSPLCAAMTGSGSGCFAAFSSRELAEWAKSRYRGNGRTYVLNPV